MSNYKFKKFNDLVNFLFSAKLVSNEFDNALDDWEASYVSITISQGLELSLNTKIIDPSGVNEYMTWKNVKPLVRSYLSQNMTQEFSNIEWFDRIVLQIDKLDIRLRCPKKLKDVFDPTIQYDSFRLNFLTDLGLHMMMANAVEKEFPADPEAFSNWNLYIYNIVEKWKKDNGK
ncbi:gp435 [Bacillus phage G]|uniref:Gp435 n=1 Tax=Bacillus phage G TaxID=2884420 RepID=G3MAH6_9CAUD|nr:gp435 [Bacillus phage G]AEO93693.1 gp435 [Bacillus phage G]